MINSVRATVLSILNKNNYGYISPSDFNLFAKQAQLDIFIGYFPRYNYQINKENSRLQGTGYSDIKKTMEDIEYFSVSDALVLNTTNPIVSNNYYLPSASTTGSDFFMIGKMLIYTTNKRNGASTAVDVNTFKLIDSLGAFIANGVASGDVIAFIKGGITQYATVVSVNSAIDITTTASSYSPGTAPWTTTGIQYSIYSPSLQEAEKVSLNKITILNNSLLTKPTLTYPAYIQEETVMTPYPPTINHIGQVLCQYIRYPKDPKWTFITLVNGEPAFDQSQPDYQDFELPLEEEPALVNKILQFAGMSIREIAAVQFGQALEQANTQQQQ
jgi:hypothetical protein